MDSKRGWKRPFKIETDMMDMRLPGEFFTKRFTIPDSNLGHIDWQRHPLGKQDNLALQGVPGAKEEPHLLYFPAEYDDEQQIHYLANGFLEKGGGFYWVDYERYLLRTGLGALEGVAQEAISTFLELKPGSGITGPLVIMGRSIGIIPAIHAMQQKEEDALCLILESGFSDTLSFLKVMGVDCADLTDKDPFENKKKISSLKKAVLFLHSHSDSIVSIRDVEWLVCESRSKATQFQIVPSEGRWDLAYRGGRLYFDVIWQFIGLRMGRRPKRRPRHQRRHAI